MPGSTLRALLASIRLLNGSVALIAPGTLGRRLGVEITESPGLGYALRLFGVRTVLLGVDLWRARLAADDPTIRRAILVHAADTAAAVVVYRRRELPPPGAITTIGISALNTVLAVLLTWRVRRAR